MGQVGKYNTYKGLSTLCTIGAPIITLASCSELFVHNSGTSLSAAGIFAIFIALLFAKDKILENFKMPPAFVLAFVGFILIVIVEDLLAPMKAVCIVTMCTSGVDELTFKKFYKSIEKLLPEKVANYKHFGFIFTTSNNVED